MRSAGCVWNDILDRDYDRRVERTRERPIASGTVSVRGGAVFMVGLALIGLLVLLQFNRFTIWLAVGSLGLVVFYPLMKRVTYWPQAWLGLTFNWGALVGWAAVMEGLAPAALLLYLSGFCWTLGYDTIYAHQDKEDDLMVGIRSTALLFGARTKTWLALFYGGAMLLLAGAGYFAGLEALFLVGLLIGAAQLAWQVHALDPEDPGDCLRKFKSNLWFGLLVTAAILAAAS
jgi:4-hydroxybenzoate polyprenyltransferase